jgi:hypothetical protein
MANTPDPWYVTERSEALAGVLLTARSDVRILKKTQLDDRMVFHVAVGAGDPLASQLLVVQVKGVMSSDPNEWMSKVEPWFGHPDQHIWLPACVFVVNVRENKAFYAWLAEPVVEDDVAGLRGGGAATFHPLDTAAVNEIVGKVKAWYTALPRQLQSA